MGLRVRMTPFAGRLSERAAKERREERDGGGRGGASRRRVEGLWGRVRTRDELDVLTWLGAKGCTGP